ncbi:hypothetical protein ACKI10_18205 [Streptomyces galilaeus]|uniref:Uncharacterized protein n=1 Tax=Streptomyces galilaeus TaxID=33899 RepID=A0ABW9INA5_STRGJ
MSDLESLGDPDHQCTELCGPYQETAERNLEALDESSHIDALYDDLNLVREHAGLLFLALDRQAPGFTLPVRSVAILLDMDENDVAAALGEAPVRARDVVAFAIEYAGEEGYVGQSMTACFRHQLRSQPETDDTAG